MDSTATVPRLPANAESQRGGDSVAVYARPPLGLLELRVDRTAGERLTASHSMRSLWENIRRKAR